MKRMLVTALILAGAAFAQGAVTLMDALRNASADANLVLLSDEGRIVGYSDDLSRTGLRVVLADDFRGEALLLITAPDGSVTHEYLALVLGGGVVTVDGRALDESLAAAGFGPPTFVTAGPPDDVPAAPGDGPGQAGAAPDLPPQAGGAPGRGAGSEPPGGGQGAGGDDDPDEGDDDDDEDENGDGGESGGGEGPPDSPGPP